MWAVDQARSVLVNADRRQGVEHERHSIDLLVVSFCLVNKCCAGKRTNGA